MLNGKRRFVSKKVLLIIENNLLIATSTSILRLFMNSATFKTKKKLLKENENKTFKNQPTHPCKYVSNIT